MKRVLKAILILLCALALAFSGAVTAFAQEGAGAENAAAQESAAPAADAQAGSDADTNTAAQTDESDPAAGGSFSLFLPASSEQYLPLQSPNDVAIGDDYIAVADGNKIYVYDRAAGEYGTFTGSVGLTYSSLCFYGNYLFFVSESNTNITYFDCTAIAGKTLNADDTQELKDESGSSIAYASFILNGKSLYCATATTNSVAVFCHELNTETLTVGEKGENLAPDNTSNKTPYFSVYNGQTYYSIETDSGDIYSVDGTSSTMRYDAYYSVYSFAIADGKCYYSSADNNHYFYVISDKDGDEPLLDSNDKQIRDVTAVEPYNEDLYLATETSVKAYSAEKLAYTGYEITQFSSGATRLGRGSTSLSVRGSRLVIADPANARVLVYDTAADRYTAVPMQAGFSPVLAAAGEQSFLVSNGTAVAFYSYAGTQLFSYAYSYFEGNIVDCAYSYGAYYLITATPRTYRITETQDTDGKLSYELSAAGTPAGMAPEALAADIEGNLWVLSGNTAYGFTEEAFLSSAAGTGYTSSIDLQGDVSDLLLDYADGIYGLTESSVLFTDGSAPSETPLALSSYVSFTDGSAPSETPLDLSSYVSFADGAKAVSFAFGFETGDAYILTDAGFIVKWSGGIESLDNIAESGTVAALAQNTLTSSLPQDLLVTIEAGAVLVPLDTARLAEGEPLPANGYERTSEERIAVNVHAVQGGAVVALYRYASGKPQSVREYSLCFLPNGQSMQPLKQDGYYTENKNETPVRRYTTNAVCLYTLPLMRQFAGARTQLPRGAAVTVLGTLSCPAADGGWGLDTDYCFVSYTFEQGTEYGFVPASYCSETAVSGGAGTEQISYRRVKKGERIELCALNNAQDTVVLEQEEQVTVHGEADGNGLVYVTYTAEEVTYGGWVLEELLADASNFGTWVLVAVAIVTAAVLASTCYLFLRKQPMVAPPVPAEEAADGADENDGGEDGDDGGDPNGDPAPPDGQ